MSPADLYASKRNKYQDRIIEIEHATLSPLMFSNTDGASPVTQKFIRQLAFLMSERTSERDLEVVSLIRTCLSFVMMRSASSCLRGCIGQKPNSTDIISIDNFNRGIRCWTENLDFSDTFWGYVPGPRGYLEDKFSVPWCPIVMRRYMQSVIKILLAVFEKLEVFQKVGIGKNKFIAAIVLRNKFRVLSSSNMRHYFQNYLTERKSSFVKYCEEKLQLFDCPFWTNSSVFQSSFPAANQKLKLLYAWKKFKPHSKIPKMFSVMFMLMFSVNRGSHRNSHSAYLSGQGAPAASIITCKQTKSLFIKVIRPACRVRKVHISKKFVIWASVASCKANTDSAVIL